MSQISSVIEDLTVNELNLVQGLSKGKMEKYGEVAQSIPNNSGTFVQFPTDGYSESSGISVGGIGNTVYTNTSGKTQYWLISYQVSATAGSTGLLSTHIATNTTDYAYQNALMDGNFTGIVSGSAVCRMNNLNSFSIVISQVTGAPLNISTGPFSVLTIYVLPSSSS